MRSKLQLKPTVKVKQTITLKGTLKMTSLGFSFAGVICLLLFITFNSNTEKVVAGNQQKSLFQNINESASSLAKEYAGKLEKSNQDFTARKESLSSAQQTILSEGSVTPTLPKEDFIHIYPKVSTGIFNVEFEMPEKGNFIPQIEIVNRKGKVVDRKSVHPEGNKVLESFIMNGYLPDGPYIVRISVNRHIYIRQVVLQKYAAAL